MSKVISSKFEETKKSGINTNTEKTENKQEEITKVKTDTVTQVNTQASSSSTVNKEKPAARGEMIRDTQEAVDNYMPPVYSLGQDIIDSKKKSRFLFFSHEVEDSEETKDVKLKIEMLQSFLTNPMPPATLDENNSDAFKEELESVKIAVNMMYNKLIGSMDVWLEKADTLKDASKERKNMIKRLRDQVSDEEALFAQSLDEYRKQMFEDAKNGDTSEKTWVDMLRFERAEKIDLDDKTVYKPEDIKQTGGDTSDVLKIKHKGRNVYFKEEENTAVGMPHDIISSCAEEKRFKNLNSDDLKDFIKVIKTLEGTDRTGAQVYGYLFALVKKEHIFKDLKERTDLDRFLMKIPQERQSKFEEFFRHFFKQYNQSAVAEHDAKIDPGRNLSRRNVATSRLATLLGIGDIVAESRTAIIKQNGQTFRGNLMEEADGIEAAGVGQGRYTEKAEDQLFILHIFDLLCGQIDRHKKNYKFITETDSEKNTMITGIKCIDNDMSFGKLTFDKVSPGRNKLPELFKRELYALPDAFVKSVLSLDASFARLILADLLEPDELDAFEDRLAGIQNALIEMEKSRTEEEHDPHAVSKMVYRDKELMKLYNFHCINTRYQLKEVNKYTYFNGGLVPSKEEIEARKKEAAKRLDITTEMLDVIFKRNL